MLCISLDKFSHSCAILDKLNKSNRPVNLPPIFEGNGTLPYQLLFEYQDVLRGLFLLASSVLHNVREKKRSLEDFHLTVLPLFVIDYISSHFSFAIFLNVCSQTWRWHGNSSEYHQELLK